MTSEDLLRALCAAWHDFDQDARGWESEMDRLVEAAERHLAPSLPLVEDDPPSSVRSVPS